MKKIETIILAVIILFGGFGCYTQIKLTKMSARNWERKNDYERRNHRPCGWCEEWYFYYAYPWWLDGYSWWENHSREDRNRLELRKSRYERHRGLDEILERGTKEGSREETHEEIGSPSLHEDRDQNDLGKNRPEKRRGIEEEKPKLNR